MFPLGLGYLNSALCKAGYITRWHDYLVHSEPLEAVLRDFMPDYIGISLRNIDDVLIRRRETFHQLPVRICETIRRFTDAPVIIGGSGFSIFPESILEITGADFGISGEGEESLPALLRALESGTDYRMIPGLVYREGDSIHINASEPMNPEFEMHSADPPRDLVDYYAGTSSMLNIQTQRGCSFNCCYCTYPSIEGCANRFRDAVAVADEFERIAAMGARYIFIVDSVFNSSAEHVAAVCEELIRRNTGLRWGCFLRPAGLTPELMRLMARAGLAHIEFGSDSFADAVLEAYRKGFAFDDILNSSRMAADENIDYCHFLISGGPGETDRTLKEGFDNSLHLKNAVILAVVGMRIYPGTALHEMAIDEGRIDRDSKLLMPEYYISPALTEDSVFEYLSHFAESASGWIPGDPAGEYSSLVARLRKKGVTGPLWSYFAMIQRLIPPTLVASKK